MIIDNPPYDHNGNIADAYNAIFKRARKGDWIVIRDGDTQWTTRYYGDHLKELIEAHPEFEAFTCITNRINNKHQKARSIDRNNDDMRYHCNKGEAFWKRYGTEGADVTYNCGLISGVMIMIKKELWDRMGGVQKRGMLGIDNEIHKNIRTFNGRIFLSRGIYIYHRYSFHDTNPDRKRDITHLRAKEK